MRGRVCCLQLLLALTIAFIFGSESRGTRDHILLPQIRDFAFNRLRTEVAKLSSRSQSYVTTDSQWASLSWSKAPIWALRPDLYYCQTVAGLLMLGALSDKRTGLMFSRVTAEINLLSICTVYILHVIKGM
jgi:hypothetical protein